MLDVLPDDLLDILGRIPSTELGPLEDRPFFVWFEMDVESHVLCPFRSEVHLIQCTISNASDAALARGSGTHSLRRG